jgi:hypothetical protein
MNLRELKEVLNEIDEDAFKFVVATTNLAPNLSIMDVKLVTDTGTVKIVIEDIGKDHE